MMASALASRTARRLVHARLLSSTAASGEDTLAKTVTEHLVEQTTPQRNVPEVVPSDDLETLIKSKTDADLVGKFIQVGDSIEEFEIPRQFEKLEWHAKMYTKSTHYPEYLKTLKEVAPSGGRFEAPILLEESQRHLMLRKPALDLIREFDAALNDDSETNQYKSVAKILVGKRGSGKSATLMTALAWARSAGWLTMHLPRPTDLISEYGAYFAGTGGPIAVLPESTVAPGVFQQPKAAQDVLQVMDDLHGEILSMLPLRRQYKHDLYKGKDGKSTLAHIMMRGLAQAPRAADALYDLRMELNQVTDVPVMIAVDEFNALYWPTALYFQSKPIRAHQLVIAKAFRFVKHVPGDIEDDDNMKTIRRARLDEAHLPKRGVLLAAVTNSVDPLPHKQQLPPARFEKFDVTDATKVEVPRYSSDEVELMLNWYQSRGACRPQSQADVGVCRTFTAGIGEKLAKYAQGATTGL